MNTVTKNGTLDKLVGVATSIGSRKNARGKFVSEDRIYVNPETNVFAVADGLGGEGHNGGQYASAEAVTAADRIAVWIAQKPLDYFDRSHNRNELKLLIEQIVTETNERIYELAHDEDHPERRGMNTTLELAVIAGGHLFHVHVGDSQLYKVTLADRDGAHKTDDGTDTGTLSLNPKQITSDESLINYIQNLSDTEFGNIVTALQRNGGKLQGVHYTDLQRMRRGYVNYLDAELAPHSSKMLRALGMKKEAFDVTCEVTPHDSDLLLMSDGASFLSLNDLIQAIGYVTWRKEKGSSDLEIDYSQQPQAIADTIHAAANRPYDENNSGVGMHAWIGFQSLKRREILIENYETAVDLLERQYGKPVKELSPAEIVSWAQQSEYAQETLAWYYGDAVTDLTPKQITDWAAQETSVFSTMEEEYGKPLEQCNEIEIADWLRDNGYDPDTNVIDKITEGIEQEWFAEFQELQGKDDVSVIYVRANLAKPTNIGKKVHWRGNDKLTVSYTGNTTNRLSRTAYDLQAANAENNALRTVIGQLGAKPDLVLAMDAEIQRLAGRVECRDASLVRRAEELTTVRAAAEAVGKTLAEREAELDELRRNHGERTDKSLVNTLEVRAERAEEQVAGLTINDRASTAFMARFYDLSRYLKSRVTELEAQLEVQSGQQPTDLEGEDTAQTQIATVPPAFYADLGEALTTATTPKRIVELRNAYTAAGQTDEAAVFAAVALYREQLDTKIAAAVAGREDDVTQGYERLLRTALQPMLTVLDKGRAAKDGQTPEQLAAYLRQEAHSWAGEMPLGGSLLEHIANVMEAHYALEERLAEHTQEVTAAHSDCDRARELLEAEIQEHTAFLDNISDMFLPTATAESLIEAAVLYETANRPAYAQIFRMAASYVADGKDGQTLEAVHESLSTAVSNQNRELVQFRSGLRTVYAALTNLLAYTQHGKVDEVYQEVLQAIRAQAEDVKEAPALEQLLHKTVEVLEWYARSAESLKRLEVELEGTRETLDMAARDKNVFYTIIKAMVEDGIFDNLDNLTTTVRQYLGEDIFDGAFSVLLSDLMRKLKAHHEYVTELEATVATEAEVVIDTMAPLLDVRLAYADVLKQLGQFDTAQAQYRLVCRADPEHQEAKTLYRRIDAFRRGTAYAAEGRVDDAMRMADRAAADEALSHAHLLYADMFKQQGHIKGARAMYKKKMQLSPHNEDVKNLYRATDAFLRGAQYAKAGRLDDALRMFERVCELDETIPKAHYYLAGLLTKMGRKDEARAHYTQEVKLNPDNEKARRYVKTLTK